MKHKKPKLLKLIKETPESRKTRVSSGKKYRTAAFKNKKKEAQNYENRYTKDE